MTVGDFVTSKTVLKVSDMCDHAEQMRVQRQEFLWLRALCPRDMGSATAVSDLTSQPCGSPQFSQQRKGRWDP